MFPIDRRSISASLLAGTPFLAVFAGWAALQVAQRPPLSIVLGAVLTAAVLVAVNFDELGGAVAGLAAAAVIVGISRADGEWDAATYLPTLVAVASAVAAAGLAGRLATDVRRAHAEPVLLPESPAIGSLGLADPATGAACLEEEIARARYTESPLAVLRLTIEPPPAGDVSGAAVADARRAAARVLDSAVDLIHVPFVCADGDLAVVLPETTPDDACRLAIDVADKLDDATIKVDLDRSRIPFRAVAGALIGVSVFRFDAVNAEDLLRAAHPHNARLVFSTQRGDPDSVRSARPLVPIMETETPQAVAARIVERVAALQEPAAAVGEEVFRLPLAAGEGR